jgi:hypothetical protein
VPIHVPSTTSVQIIPFKPSYRIYQFSQVFLLLLSSQVTEYFISSIYPVKFFFLLLSSQVNKYFISSIHPVKFFFFFFQDKPTNITSFQFIQSVFFSFKPSQRIIHHFNSSSQVFLLLLSSQLNKYFNLSSQVFFFFFQAKLPNITSFQVIKHLLQVFYQVSSLFFQAKLPFELHPCPKYYYIRSSLLMLSPSIKIPSATNLLHRHFILSNQEHIYRSFLPYC